MWNTDLGFAPSDNLLNYFMDLAASAGFGRGGEEKIFIQGRPQSQGKIFNNKVIEYFFNEGGSAFPRLLISVYFYARSQGLSLRETQTYAFFS